MCSMKPVLECDDLASHIIYTRLGSGTYQLFLDRADSGVDIGSVTFALIRNGVANGCGWGLREELQGRGVMARILPMVLADQAAMGLRVVRKVIAEDNEPSWRLAARCGFQQVEPSWQRAEGAGSGAEVSRSTWAWSRTSPKLARRTRASL